MVRVVETIEIPKDEITENTAEVISVKVIREQWTTIGTCKFGLGMRVSVDKLEGEYDQMFSLDGDVVSGSAGRILTSVGIDELDANDSDKVNMGKFSKLVGKSFTVKNRGGKLYWYRAE